MSTPQTRPRVCVVGSGTWFVSGLSYYTFLLAQSLHERAEVSVILMRKLIPRRFYPGASRVGTAIMEGSTADFAPTFDGIDWYAVPSVPRGLRFLRRQRPQILILQWWSGSVLPWYLLLARACRRRGGKVVLELHEDLDTGEARIPFVAPIIGRGLRKLVAMSSAYIVHSDWDRDRMAQSLGLDADRTVVIPLGPFPMAKPPERHTLAREHADEVTILFFGTIRPYKGLEHLVEAFDALPRSDGQRWRLLVVGETWEGWTQPLEAIAASAHRDDIEVINRYVRDDEVPGYFDRADLVALPYLRSSASGPLALTMTRGLPVVVTSVGGLDEMAQGYSGAVLVQPADVPSLTRGIVSAAELIGQHHEDVSNWTAVADQYLAVITDILCKDTLLPGTSSA